MIQKKTTVVIIKFVFATNILAFIYLLFFNNKMLGLTRLDSESLPGVNAAEFHSKNVLQKDISALITALDDNNWFARNAAAKALIQINPKVISDVDKLLSLVSNTKGSFASVVALEALSHTDIDIISSRLQYSEDISVREGAAYVLGAFRSEKYVSVLVHSLEDNENSSLRDAAADALGSIGSKESVTALISTIRNSNSENLAYSAVEALGNINSEQAISFLSTLLQEDSGRYVSFATEALIRNGSPNAISSVSSAIRKMSLKINFDTCISPSPRGDVVCSDPDTKNFREIIFGLSNSTNKINNLEVILKIFQNIDKKYGIPLILIQSVKNGDMHSRQAAINILGKPNLFDNDDVTSALKTTLSDIEIVSAFAEYTSQIEAVQLLENSTNFPEFSINLPKQVGSQFVQTLIHTLQDKKVENQYAAINALGGIASEEAVTALVSVLSNGSEDKKFAVLLALGNIRSDSAIPDIIEVLKDKKSFDNGYAAYALGQIGSPKAIPALINRLNEILPITDKGSEAAYIIQALGRLRAETAIPIIIRFLSNDKTLNEIDPENALLSNGNWYVREKAVYALGEIGSEKVIPFLIAALEDENWYVRIAASEALKKVGSKAVPKLTELLRRHNISSVRNKLFDSEDLDIRRNVAFVLGKLDSLPSRTIDALKILVEDESENIDLRQMAAIALERTGHDKSNFFERHKLTNPLKVSCPYVQNGNISQDIYIYVGQCVSNIGRRLGGGGGWAEIYQTLKNLLNRR
jgi:HEAT repeat protein